MILNYSSYNSYLKGALTTRQKVNPSYSLRAMAKQVGLSASSLSDVMAGKKNLSENKAVEVANRLKLSPRESRYFCTLVQYQSAKSEELRAMLASQLRSMNPHLRDHFEITVDRFSLIADWYHTAILEMTCFDDNRLYAETISQSLGITVTQAQNAIDLLVRLNLIETLGNSRYKKNNGKVLVQSDVPNQALRKYHHKMMELAQESLRNQLPSEKVVGSETMAIDTADLPEAREIIETCFQQINQLTERAKTKDHVYHLGIQMFRLTGQGRK